MRVIITNPKHNCPKCGHSVLIGLSAQCSEDSCEMWFECEACGYEPAGDMGDRVETVWGWQDEYAGDALDVWITKINDAQSVARTGHRKGEWQMKCSDTPESVEAKRDFVAKQTKEAESTGDVTLRNCGEIRTGTIPVWMAFRCLYCGEYFNQTMAEEHFGMTRERFLSKFQKENDK